jgi:hypothetical protein
VTVSSWSGDVCVLCTRVRAEGWIGVAMAGDVKFDDGGRAYRDFPKFVGNGWTGREVAHAQYISSEPLPLRATRISTQLLSPFVWYSNAPFIAVSRLRSHHV